MKLINVFVKRIKTSIMGLDCNIIPQIKVGDSYTDSKCFQDLWDRAKKLYPNNPIKARAVAKANYEALKSASFCIRVWRLGFASCCPKMQD